MKTGSGKAVCDRTATGFPSIQIPGSCAASWQPSARRGTRHARKNNPPVALTDARLPTPIEETPLDMFRHVMETNFFGGLRCIKAVIPSMRERRRGTIVNVTSVAGRIAIAAHASYAASKWAFEALSECLAQEMRAFNVRVAIVEPGVIATPIVTRLRPLQANSPYPHSRRLRALFGAPRAKPTPPSVVADAVREIVDGGSWQLRYPVGPDALPLLKVRVSKTDEQIIDEASQSDEAFVARVKRDYGLEVAL